MKISAVKVRGRNKCEFKMPPVDAFYEMLQLLYTEEEAETATRFPIGLFDLNELTELYRKDQAELEPLLERMADKGHLFVMDTKEGKRKYELPPWYPGVMEMSILRMINNPDKTELGRYIKLDEQIRKEGAQYSQKMLDDGMDLKTLRSTLPKPVRFLTPTILSKARSSSAVAANAVAVPS